jgi:hypothetical protein
MALHALRYQLVSKSARDHSLARGKTRGKLSDVADLQNIKKCNFSWYFILVTMRVFEPPTFCRFSTIRTSLGPTKIQWWRWSHWSHYLDERE